MTYYDVMRTPYSLLLMMQKDKIMPDYDSGKNNEEHISGKELLRRKRGMKN